MRVTSLVRSLLVADPPVHPRFGQWVENNSDVGELSLVVTLALSGWVGFLAPATMTRSSTWCALRPAPHSRSCIQKPTHNDVHPPGPYLINKALWDATGNWSTARLTTAVFAATTIWLGADSIRLFLTTTSGLGIRATGGVWIACSLTG